MPTGTSGGTEHVKHEETGKKIVTYELEHWTGASPGQYSGRFKRTCSMFTIVAPAASLSLDSHFIKKPAATFFVAAEGDGMAERGILAGDTLIVDRSRTPGRDSIVVAAIDGELTVRSFLDGGVPKCGASSPV